jgi:predicted amidohydrolase
MQTIRKASSVLINNIKIPRISIAQLTSTNNVEDNFSVCERLVQTASKEHESSMIFFPECFAFLGENSEQTLQNAQALDGPLFQRYKQLAKMNRIAISFGGFHEKHPSINKVYNSHVLVDSNGEIVSVYRKLHLFDVQIPHRNLKLMESATTISGSDIVVYSFEDDPVVDQNLRFGVSICFDLRFPEQYLLMRSKGANIMLVPAAFTKATGDFGHWHTLLKARAIETQSFVIAAAQVGMHNSRRESYGHSLVVDPWGQVLCDMQKSEGGSVSYVELDMKLIETARENIPLNKRNDIYSIVEHNSK